MKSNVHLIFAVAYADGAFGLEGGLPWPRVQEDMKHFQSCTEGSVLIMGSNTWNTLPLLERRAGRTLVCIGKNTESRWLNTLDFAFEDVKSIRAVVAALPINDNTKVFIIGGPALLSKALEEQIAFSAIITEVAGAYDHDVNALNLLSRIKHKAKCVLIRKKIPSGNGPSAVIKEYLF